MTIRIRNLLKRYGDVCAVDIQDLTISEGQRVGLVGNNGAGKTTLLRLALDLVEATRGAVFLADSQVSSSDAWKSATSAHLDDGFLIDFLTPHEYLLFVGRSYGLSSAVVDRRMMNFEHFFAGGWIHQKKLIRDLSTGNRQKVGLVAALISRPSILLLDEPFANLDPSSQIALKHALLNLSHECGTTMLVSSHGLSHITEISDRILLIDEGRIVSDTGVTDQTLPSLEQHFSAKAI